MFFMLIRLLQSGLIKGTLQSFPVILIKYWLVFANLCRKYNRKPAMQTFYILAVGSDHCPIIFIHPAV